MRTKRLTLGALKNIQPDKDYMVELSRLWEHESEVVYWGKTRFHRQGSIVAPLAVDWAEYDLENDIAPSMTDCIPDDKYCLVAENYRMLVFEMPVAGEGTDVLTFVCPHCGEADRLRKRSENTTFTEFVQIRADGAIWDIGDMSLEEEGLISFYCEECGELVRGVHSEEAMAEWIRKQEKR